MRLTLIRPMSNIHQLVARVKSDAPMYISANKELFYRKVSEANHWYTRLLGLDEVKFHQDRVTSLQDRLFDAQERRRDVGRALAETRKLSNQLQDEIHKVKRQDDLDRYLTLMKEETEVLKKEQETALFFQECDQRERELFSAFTNAVRDSHEKQRAQLEYTKYFGIILSIAGSFLAFCYTSFRKHDLKRFIEESLKDRVIPTVVQPDYSEQKKMNEIINANTTQLLHSYHHNEEEFKKTLTLLVGVTSIAACIFGFLIGVSLR